MGPARLGDHVTTLWTATQFQRLAAACHRRARYYADCGELELAAEAQALQAENARNARRVLGYK